MLTRLLRVFFTAAAASALCAAPARAQAEQHLHAGEQLGRVAFPTSCPGSVQPAFERALALLHSFWWEEAEAGFETITRDTPGCAMAHWGLALTRWGNPFAGGPTSAARLAEGAAAASEAVRVGGGTDRERAYIAAVAVLYADAPGRSNADRLAAYAGAMADVEARHPDDMEARIFHALAVIASASPTDTTFARQKQALATLEPLFMAHAEHPGLAHYVIHATDSPALADLGLQAARRYAEIAPSVPHAQHMPSHIFIRLGLWEENIAANQRSFEAGFEYARATDPEAVGAHEFHALDYQVYGYLQLGRDRDAEAVVARSRTFTKIVPPNALTSGYPRAAMPARLLLERDRWAAAAALPVASDLGPIPEVVNRFARGIGAGRSGDADGARREAGALASLATRLDGAQQGYWASIARIKETAVRAWAAFAAGDTAGALAVAREAADREDETEKHPVTPGEVLPARELYADMLLAAGRPAEALRAYETSLGNERNRARSLLGAARAARQSGDAGSARAWYGKYLALMAKADGDRPGIAEARREAR